MAETLVLLSAVQATTQLAEQAFRVLSRLRKAHERQKSLFEVLGSHQNELESVKTVIGIIVDEEALQTATVGEELYRLKDVQSKLKDQLDALDPRTRGKINQFAHQFAHGSADERKLRVLMDELSRVKATLLLRIQVTHVGVMRNVEKQFVANAEVVQRIDQFLREEIGSCEGLRIARLLQGRRPSSKLKGITNYNQLLTVEDDGTVPLTPDDLKFLRSGDSSDGSTDGTLVDESPTSLASGMTERIILRNMARHQALQINAAIGEDIWKHMNRLVIEDNVAENQAVQFNHGATLEAMGFALDRQDRRIATAR